MLIAARSSKSGVCNTANSPVTGFRENSCLADSVLIRYVTLEKRSESTAYKEEEEEGEQKIKQKIMDLYLKNNRRYLCTPSQQNKTWGYGRGVRLRAIHIFRIA